MKLFLLPGTKPSQSKAIVKIVLVAFAALILLNALMLVCGNYTVFPHISNMLKFASGDDSWAAMQGALAELDKSSDIYQDLFFTQHVKFQYPMSSLLIFSAIKELFGRVPANLLVGISWAAVVATITATAYFCILLPQRFDIGINGRQRIALALLSAMATLAFYPLVVAFSLGQIQSWLDALFAVACVCWMLERRMLAGVAIGIICLIKPQFGLFFVWGLLRRQWPFLIGWASVCIPGELAALLLYGFPNNIGYLKVLQFLSRHGESFYANQSVNGILNRIFLNGNNAIWSANSFPDYNVFIYTGTLVSSATLILLAMLWGRKRPSAGNPMDFIGAALTFTVASPIAWEHHYGILPVAVFAVLFCAMTLPDTPRKLSLLLLGLAYLGTAVPPSLLNRFSDTTFNFVQSYLFLSASTILAMAYCLRDRFPVVAAQQVPSLQIGAAPLFIPATELHDISGQAGALAKQA